MNYEHKQKVIKARKHIKNGQFQEAQDLMNELLLDGFEDAEILKDVGLLYSEMGKKDLAAVYIRQSFDLDKSYETLEILANANFEAGKFDLAAIQFEELVKAKPDPNFYMKSIDSYEKNDMYEEAIRVAKMFYYADGTATAHSKLIFMLITAGMEEESIDYANVMVEKYPNHPATYNMLGFLHECIYNDYDTAKKYFYKSAKRGFMGAYYNLAVCCKQSEDFVNAEKYFKKLISMDEDEQYDTNYSLGSVYMAQRKLRLGYKYYLKRASAKGVPESYKNRTWDGKPHPRGTLYVITEQGFGDNIQFARYLPLAAKYFKRVIHGTRKVLETLLKDSFEKYPNIEVVSTDEIVKYDRAALIMDLPYIMHDTYYNIPSPEPYLVHSEEKKKAFQEKFFKNDDFKIGLNWRAKGMGLRDAVYRTIDGPYYFRDILKLSDTSFYSFQMGDIFGMLEKYPQIIDVMGDVKDFSDSAALLKNLDVLITVDTALAHLAGALGVKTYLLLCHAPDWRWFDNTEKTEWYSCVTLIKQKDRKTWDDVAEKLNEYIKKDLEKYNKKRKRKQSKKS